MEEPNEKLTIAVLAAGAAGMYCGSCLRDNALSLALKRLGHDAVMIPLYTPIKTDAPSAAIGKVFYGGINTFLQHASGIFRHTPRALDWLLDRPWLLSWAGSYGSQTSPAQLGELTLDVLKGETGKTAKELFRLVKYLKDKIRPQVVSLPNLMFIGAARALREELGAAVIVECTGEDIFLDALDEPHKSQARELIRNNCGHVDRFVATSRYYAEHVAEYLDQPRERIDVVYPGISEDHLAQEPKVETGARTLSVGYMARICPEKGLDRLVDAMLLLQQMSGMKEVTLRVAGYLGKAHKAWHAELEERIRRSPLASKYTNLGEVDLDGKRAHLDGVDVLCVPTAYPEPKGIYVLEALARGTPVVLPHHGAFPELVEITQGGVTVPPGDAGALARALAEVLADPERRRQMAQSGQSAVRRQFLDTHMARKMVEVYRGARNRSV